MEYAALEADEAADIQEVQAWAAGLEVLHARIAGRFARAEPRRRALAYLKGLLGNVARKNGWQLAEHTGERTPDGMQRLLATADWDPDLVRDDLRAYVVEHLGDAAAVLVVDETGFVKKGTTSAGVQRQYSGTAGKIDNCQLGVFLAYASPMGRAMIDQELYLPRSWTDDPARCRAARVTADEADGGDPALRGWLEDRRVAYVLAVKRTEPLAVDGPQGRRRAGAEQLAASVPAERWITCSAGQGAQGRRLYDWTRVELAAPTTSAMARWLLVRRSRSDGELAFYACCGPAATPLVGLVRVAGTRCAVEEGFQQAKARSAWTTMRSASGRAGTGMSPWPAGAGVGYSGHAGLGAGLVAVAPTPSGPCQARTLPPTRAASAAGALGPSFLCLRLFRSLARGEKQCDQGVPEPLLVA
jgi:DDE superfamily endonuclease